MLEFRSMTNDYWTVSVRMIDTLLRLWHWLHSMPVGACGRAEHHNSSLSACNSTDSMCVQSATIINSCSWAQLSRLYTPTHTQPYKHRVICIHTPLHLTTRRKWTFMYPECCVLHEKTFEANHITHYWRTAHILQHLSNSQQSIANPLFNW